ncbi:MAG TPA: STAS domain-containing protein [Candidatus Angelobacter sp.]|nr:STAS domain-containing protein [Candidatus Angelobacter sp.]
MTDEKLTIEDVHPSTNGQRILRLTGPLVLNSFFAFQTLVREDQSSLLVLDFTSVPYIDSAGIGALVGAYVNRQKDGRRLMLVGVTPRVRTALQVTKVEQFFQFADTLPERQASAS